MKTLKGMMPYLVIMILNFYLLPLLINDIGSSLIMLLVIIPLICFICSVFYGAKHAFHWLYAVIVALLFIPAIFIFYNSSAWVYILDYGIVALIGNLLGTLFSKTRK